MNRRYIVRGPDGTERQAVLEAGRWYGLDGLPWHVVGELSRMVEVTTADVSAAERGGWRIVGEVKQA